MSKGTGEGADKNKTTIDNVCLQLACDQQALRRGEGGGNTTTKTGVCLQLACDQQAVRKGVRGGNSTASNKNTFNIYGLICDAFDEFLTFKSLFCKVSSKPPKGYKIVVFTDLKKFLKVLIDDIYFIVGGVAIKRERGYPMWESVSEVGGMVDLDTTIHNIATSKDIARFLGMAV